MEGINSVVEGLRSFVNGYIGVQESEEWKDELRRAKKDWVSAQNYFENVTDPDLIDHAIYKLEAAEAKYTYLLKRAREYE